MAPRTRAQARATNSNPGVSKVEDDVGEPPTYVKFGDFCHRLATRGKLLKFSKKIKDFSSSLAYKDAEKIREILQNSFRQEGWSEKDARIFYEDLGKSAISYDDLISYDECWRIVHPSTFRALARGLICMPEDDIWGYFDTDAAMRVKDHYGAGRTLINSTIAIEDGDNYDATGVEDSFKTPQRDLKDIEDSKSEYGASQSQIDLKSQMISNQELRTSDPIVFGGVYEKSAASGDVCDPKMRQDLDDNVRVIDIEVEGISVVPSGHIEHFSEIREEHVLSASQKVLVRDLFGSQNRHFTDGDATGNVKSIICEGVVRLYNEDAAKICALSLDDFDKSNTDVVGNQLAAGSVHPNIYEGVADTSIGEARIVAEFDIYAGAKAAELEVIAMTEAVVNAINVEVVVGKYEEVIQTMDGISKVSGMELVGAEDNINIEGRESQYKTSSWSDVVAVAGNGRAEEVQDVDNRDGLEKLHFLPDIKGVPKVSIPEDVGKVLIGGITH